jgi:hypothetical protein
MSTPSLRKYVEEHGGTVRDSKDGISVEFPEPTPEAIKAAAAEIEAAVERAAEYGTRCIRLWRERGEGWHAAESREEHPGFWYVCQIDEQTGRPIGCECAAIHVCHHLGAAISDWRQRVGYAANGDAALAAWEETLRRVRESRPSAMVEEAWT